MIPLRLELTNFLSYRETAVLDFNGIHLACISGANGAGKSYAQGDLRRLWQAGTAPDDPDPRHPPESLDPGGRDRRRDGGDTGRPLPEPDPAGATLSHRPRGGTRQPFGGGAF